MRELLTFEAAQKWLAGRVNVPTGLSSRELALAPDFPAQVRAHAFFSARVAQAEILAGLRESADAYARGEINLSEARLRMKTYLVRQGFTADDVGMADTPPAGMDEDSWQAAKSITNLASTRRLDLILQQNARMAWAVGRKEVAEHPAVKERWPYYRYIAVQDERTRPEHARLHGLVLRKDDPFWKTHTPPWEFNCRCDIEEADEEDAQAAGGAGRAVTRENPDGSQSSQVAFPGGGEVNVNPADSGFVFRSDEPFLEFDMSRIVDLDLRRRVARGLADEAAKSKAMPILRGVGAMPRGAFGDDDDTLVRVGDGAVAVVGEQGKKIAAIYDAASRPGGGHQAVDLRPVEGRTRSMIEAVRPSWKLDGYHHAINTDDVRHAISKHGPGKERDPGQVGLTREDFKRIALVIDHPDKVVPGSKADSVVLSRTFPDGTTYYVEKRQAGRRRLMTNTMWKKRPESAQDAAETTP